MLLLNPRVFSFYGSKTSNLKLFDYLNFRVKYHQNLTSALSAQLLASYISKQLVLDNSSKDIYFRKSFKFGITKTFQMILKNDKLDLFLGIKVLCSGRFKKSKSNRKQSLLYSIGILNTSKITSLLDFGFSKAISKHGVSGIKV